jgi:hypothetical protein
MRLCLIVLGLLAVLPAFANGLGGRVKLEAFAYDAGADSPDAVIGYRRSSALAGQLRLAYDRAWDRWQLNAAWQVDARHGSAVARDRLLGDVATPTDWWWLRDTAVDGERTRVEQRFDRLNVGYTGRTVVARLGRQALTWGSGMVFHPMDLVNPFQPVATDTAYKRGADMAWVQWLMNDGSDVQGVVVPHRRRDSTLPDADRPTTAVLANIVGGPLQWTLLGAKDRADTTVGIGVSGPAGSTVWNLEVVPTRLGDGGTRTTWLGNLNYATVVDGHNLTLFAEYYRNGFGMAGDNYTVASLAPALVARLQQGERFVTGRDYLAAGARWSWTPLVELEPTLIVNLRDRSGLFDCQLAWSLSDNATVKGGVRLAMGPRGSEFGGLEIMPGAGQYLARPSQAFVRWEAYF